MRFSHANVFVRDQAEALAFFTEKLGFEVRQDISFPDMNYRWLTVGPTDQPDVALIVSIPVAGVFEPDTIVQINDLVAKGASGGVHFSSDDVRADIERLRGHGVEISQEPEERPYGTDAEFTDPSGNRYRMTQVNYARIDESVASGALTSN